MGILGFTRELFFITDTWWTAVFNHKQVEATVYSAGSLDVGNVTGIGNDTAINGSGTTWYMYYLD